MRNPKVAFLALLAILCLILAFTHHWFWIIGAVALTIYNQKQLFKKETTTI